MSIVAQHKIALGRELRRALDGSAGLEVHYCPSSELLGQGATSFKGGSGSSG